MTRTLRQRLLRVVAPWTVILCAAILILCAAILLPPLLLAGAPPLESTALALSLLLVASIAGAMMLVRTIAGFEREIETMTITARENARGDLARQVDVAAMSIVELRELAEAINAMSERARGDIAEMTRLARVRSEFLGNVSHELRTPIFSVQGYLETLIDGAIDDPLVKHEFLEKAHQNVLRLHTLLTDLIEISRIESGEMKMSFRYFDPVVWFRSVVEELRPTAEMAGVSLEFSATDPGRREPTALGDRERLKQVVTNLVENAIKYNRPDGRVVVEVIAGEDETTVKVRDTGIGIPAQDLGRIFERFYRVNKDRSRSVGGSGLGLAIVKHIIEAHGSRIVVESTPGVGSCFSFSIGR